MLSPGLKCGGQAVDGHRSCRDVRFCQALFGLSLCRAPRMVESLGSTPQVVERLTHAHCLLRSFPYWDLVLVHSPWVWHARAGLPAQGSCFVPG